jgi:hypothetical protein
MSEVDSSDADRAALLHSIGIGGEASERAAIALKSRPEWITGEPPRELLEWILEPGCDPDSQVFGLAREWERSPVCCALLAELDAANDPARKTHIAWLLKHLPDPREWERYAALARSRKEPPQVRRFLIEGLEHMVFARFLDWEELGPLVEELRSDREATVREGIAGLIGSLSHSARKTAMLVDMLSDGDDAVTSVATSALTRLALRRDDALRSRAEHLLHHRSLSVRILAERLISGLESKS